MRNSPSLLLAFLLIAPAPLFARAAVSNADVGSLHQACQGISLFQAEERKLGKPPAGMMNNDNSPTSGQFGGITALITYSLLAAGENPQDPNIIAAVDFLKKAKIGGVYALGLRMQVWLLLPTSKENSAYMKRDAETMLAMTQSRGSARGMHDYTAMGTSYSHSRSQYAVLGCWAAEQLLPEAIPLRYWSLAEQGWLSHQDPSGGWTYMAIGETDARHPGHDRRRRRHALHHAGIHSRPPSRRSAVATAASRHRCRNRLADRQFDKVATDRRLPARFSLYHALCRRARGRRRRH